MDDFEIPKQEEKTQEEKQKFLECILEDESFSKQYSFIDGKMIVVMRTRTREELETIMNEVYKAKPQTDMQYAEFQVKYNLAYAVQEIIIKNNKTKIEGTFEERLKLITTIVNPTKYYMICKALEKFDSLMQQYTKEVLDIENF